MTLLDKAKARTPKYRTPRLVTKDDVELFHAYVRKEVSMAQVMHAISGERNSTAFYLWFHRVALTQRILPSEEKP